MSSMMDESDDSSEDPPPVVSTSTDVQPQAMEIIHTSATIFIQTTIQNPGAPQDVSQIITNYSSALSDPLLATSSLASQTTTSEKMEEEEPKIKCVACLDEYPAASIAFSCEKCTDGKLCSACMTKHFSTWKRKAFQDSGLTVDTGQQVYFIYSSHIFACPLCKTLIAPVTRDPNLAWYKAPKFPPPTPGCYAAISGDFADANVDIHSFKNGFSLTRYYNNYPAYIQGKTQLPGDCYQCGDGQGRYVRIKAKDAATFDRDPWQGGRPSCLMCPADPEFGPEEDLFYCAGCFGSILHTRHFNTSGQVQKGQVYTVVFKQT